MHMMAINCHLFILHWSLMYLLRHPPNTGWLPHPPGCDCDRAVLYLAPSHLRLTAQSTQTGKGRKVCHAVENFL